MKTRDEIEKMQERAYAEQGWREDGSQAPITTTEEWEERRYAEGVEAGLIWALGRAGDPFPR